MSSVWRCSSVPLDKMPVTHWVKPLTAVKYNRNCEAGSPLVSASQIR